MKKRFLLTGLGLGLLTLSPALIYWRHNPFASRKPPVYLQSPLGAAILSRDAPRVERLLRQGADPNVQYSRTQPVNAKASPTSSGLSPLIVAALSDNPGVYWDCYDYQGMETPPSLQNSTLLEVKKLHTLRDNPAITQSLLAHGANPNAADSHEWTPLLSASINSNVNIARALLDGGADISQTRKGNETVLMDAAQRNNTAFIDLLLKKGAYVNALDDFGVGALAAACNAPVYVNKPQHFKMGRRTETINVSELRHGDLAVARLLVGHGAAVNPLRTGQLPTQPLTVSVQNLNAPLARFLLESGANPNVPDGNQLSAPGKNRLYPLMIVPRAGRPTGQGFAFLLMTHGADIHTRSRDGNTALTWAADKGDLAMVRLLLDNGAEVNAVNRADHTALWFAYNNGDRPLRDILLTQGADAANSQGAALPAWRAGIGNYDIRGLDAFQ